MRLVLIGASHFSLRCLEKCLGAPGISVVGIVTAPQTFSISYRPAGVKNVLHTNLATVARNRRIPVVILKRSMSEPGLLQAVTAWRPAVFLVAGWYHMVPRSWRRLAPTYGLHASLLPDYSGGAPLVWAIINGETITGITLFKMDDGVDSGPIASQAEEPIHPDDTIATLYARIEERGLGLLDQALPRLADGTLTLRQQDDTKRRVVPQRSPADGIIDWTRDVVSIDRFIRAQTRPYPGAFTWLAGRPLHIWRAAPALVADRAPDLAVGEVVRLRDNIFVVTCGRGHLALDEVSHLTGTYRRGEMCRLFGNGGQRLGEEHL